VLPSSRFSKVAIGVAVGLLLALAYVIKEVPSPSSSIALSNLLQTAIIFWAACCCGYVARGSSTYLRQLWTLLTLALFLGCGAQGLEAYYQSFTHIPAFTPWPSDILFFLWVTPAAMMFQPPSTPSSKSIDWQQVLDYAQIGVVALAAYLYFFYLPWRWEAGGPQMVARILRLQMIRDTLLAVGFLVYATLIPSPVIKALLRRVAVLFFLTSISPLYYLSVQAPDPFRANWADLLWCVPYVFAAIFAATWNHAGEFTPELESWPFHGKVMSRVLPVVIPLLVLFMGRRIAVEQMTIAWTAITASFVLYAGSLALTNEKQRRIADDLRQTQRALQRSEHMFLSAFRSSPDFVALCAVPSGIFLEVNDSFVRQVGYSRQETLGKTALDLNLWADPHRRTEVMDKFMKQGEVREEEFVCRTKSGQTLICQFFGSLIDLDGERYALSVVRDITVRKQAEDALRASEERFRTLVREMDVGVVLHGPDAEIQFANQAAQKMFDISLAEARGKTSADLDLICFREDGTEVPFSMRFAPRALRTGQTIKDEVVGWRRRDSSKVLWTLANVVPQSNSDGRIVGAINTFTDITERRRVEDELHQLSTRLLQLQDEERRRLGRELHDSLAQTVLAITLDLAKAMRSAALDEPSRHALTEARRLLQEMSQEIRTLSYLLHPPLLDQLGLVSAIKEYAEGYSQRSGISLGLDLPEDSSRLPQNVELALFRIVQESLSNIQRHSGATSAHVSLQFESEDLILKISDQGRGMSRSTSDSQNGHAVLLGVGILGMRERMTQLGGKLDIDSSVSGTAVKATIPWRAEVFDVGSYPRRR
jgi:PAS domain S-box-containing protein